MNRRFLKLLSLWILPLLIARAVIPAGYMLSTADGLRLEFCPAVIQSVAPPAVDHAAHAAHHDASVSQHAMHQADQGAEHPANAHENAPCPFSLVAAIALLDVPFLPASAVVADDQDADFVSVPAFNVGPPRIDQIRGPPVLS